MYEQNVRKTELPNGIRVITEKMSFVRSVAIGVWIRVGSSNENEQNNGISHFLEHMLFKGTQNRSAFEIASSLESLGGSINGSTGKDNSLYTAHVLDENIEIAIDVLSDLLLNPLFSKEDIELEKNVVISEISHAEETPEEMVADYFYSNLFPNHPLGFFIYGTPENVARFDSSSLSDFLNKEYSFDKIVFAAAGNLEHNHVVELVEKYFNKERTIEPVSTQPLITRPKQGLVFHPDESSHLAHICIGSRIFGYNDERKFAFILMDILLGGGMSSRLFQNIREKYGFAYALYSYTDFMADAGVFGTYMACSMGDVEQSIDLIRKEFKKLVNNSITTDELDLAKAQVKASLIMGLESSYRRMKRIGERESYNGKHLSVEQILDKIEKTKINDLTNLAREFLDESKMNITLLAPDSVNIKVEALL